MVSFQRTAQWLFGTAVVLLTAWVLRDFLAALAWSCIIAVASWPYYERFAPPVRRTWSALAFTLLVGVLFLAPLGYALLQISFDIQRLIPVLIDAQRTGLVLPSWLLGVPGVGHWLAQEWQSILGTPGGLVDWLRHLKPGPLLHWVRTWGVQMLDRVVIAAVTLATLFFLYRDGAFLAAQAKIVTRRALGAHGEHYLFRAAATVRGTVNGLVLLGLGEGVLLGVAYGIVGLPSPALWGGVTGVLAIIPFAGPIVLLGASLYLFAAHHAMLEAGLLYAWGTLVFFVADHFVRPVLIGDAAKLPFLWTLLGIFGGLETFGLIGVFLGPVVMSLGLALWREWSEDLKPVADEAGKRRR